jgi:hypothetical protein
MLYSTIESYDIFENIYAYSIKEKGEVRREVGPYY